MIVFFAPLCSLQSTYNINSFPAVTPAGFATSDFYPVVHFAAATAAASSKAIKRFPH